MAAANVNYSLPSQRIAVNLNVSYTGAQTDQIFQPPTFAPDTVKLSDYALVSLTGRYALGSHIELYVRAENLFNEDYVNVVGYRAPGRSGLRIGQPFRLRPGAILITRSTGS